MKKIAIFTIARSDFGILKNIINKLFKSKNFKSKLIVGGAHKFKIFGDTFKEIKFKKSNIIYLDIKYFGWTDRWGRITTTPFPVIVTCYVTKDKKTRQQAESRVVT